MKFNSRVIYPRISVSCAHDDGIIKCDYHTQTPKVFNLSASTRDNLCGARNFNFSPI